MYEFFMCFFDGKYKLDLIRYSAIPLDGSVCHF